MLDAVRAVSADPPEVTAEVDATGRCTALMVEAAPRPETRRVDSLALDLLGIPGTRHHGFTRKAGPREPWYARGMEMRSGRQLTVVSSEELAEVASAMEIATLAAEWIGANVLVEGIGRLSWLPAGTRLVFAEATLVVEGQNAPCRISGRAIARHVDPDNARPGLDLKFPKLAVGRRGLLATVERAGTIRAGEPILARLPRQWIWRG